MRLVEQAYRDLGITQYTYRLSLRDKLNRAKYVENDEMWDLAENMLREAMDSLKLPYTEAPGEAAFYGPKLDIQLADVMGHQETYSTIQIDFHLPNQFELGYIGADGQVHRPVMIHRGVISTMERMVSYLIELYAGAFPVWLAPVQAVVLPITERQNDYAKQVLEKAARRRGRARNSTIATKNCKRKSATRSCRKFPTCWSSAARKLKPARFPCAIAPKATWARVRWSSSARTCAQR